MVAYSFKAQFAPLVESRAKRQTIRALGKRRPPWPGESLQLYTGMRTKACRKLVSPDPICISAEPVQITAEGIKLGDRWLNQAEQAQMAVADGFENLTSFYDFFRQTHGLPFQGFLIKWEIYDCDIAKSKKPS
jgi:hypothetical protein